MNHYPFRIEHILIFVLSFVVLFSIWRIYKPKIKKLQQKIKLYLSRKWKPKSPKDCPNCQAGVELAILKPNVDVIPYAPWGLKTSPNRKQGNKGGEPAITEPKNGFRKR